jgi:hypothetical protein
MSLASLIDSVSDEKFREIVVGSCSYSECLQKLGYLAKSGTMFNALKQRIERLNIDTSHFQQKPPTIRTKENIFVENSTCVQKVLRRWFRKEPIPYKCSICGQEPFWNGQEMIMILDHINGVNNDDRLENLRWVCPNCNSQLPTTNGRNIKHKYKPRTRSVVHKHKCPQCGNLVTHENELCRKCIIKNNQENNQNTKKPTALNLAETVQFHGFVNAAKILGVNKRIIRQWCVDYGIPDTKKDLVNWYNSQIGIQPKPTKEKRARNEMVRPVKQIDTKTKEVLNVFPNQTEACKYLNGKNPSHIGDVCRGLRKTAYGYIWEFA